MVYASVAAKCVSGSAAGSTSANGSYALFVVNGIFPCAIEVSDGSRKLHSVALSSTALAVAHVTPLTEQLVGQLSADTAAFFESFSATVAATLTPSRTMAAEDAVFASLAASGLAVPSRLTSLIPPLRPALVPSLPRPVGPRPGRNRAPNWGRRGPAGANCLLQNHLPRHQRLQPVRA